MEKATMTPTDLAFLREVGGQPLEGSGHEEEANSALLAEFSAKLRAAGSLTCFLHADEVPTPPAGWTSQTLDSGE